MPEFNKVKEFLDEKVEEYNQPLFIENDPIVIPHLFNKKQDIEISGLFAAVLAWGQRKTIINKCRLLMELMDNSPYDFILNHKAADLKPFESFKHRTFNSTDTLYFISFLQDYYKKYNSLEEAFNPGLKSGWDAKEGLVGFHNRFFALEYAPHRTKKHIATPERKAACKRLNMYLRWLVRKDDKGVDFGIWDSIKPAKLICPCDVHVDRVARKLNLITRKQTDWITAVELTEALKSFDPEDPVKYDFALFGLGVEEKM
ncbi:MAG: TIGR02757 family protein [Candidatus Cyclobacteriaceae bacterium M2_1C_046]